MAAAVLEAAGSVLVLEAADSIAASEALTADLVELASASAVSIVALGAEGSIVLGRLTIVPIVLPMGVPTTAAVLVAVVVATKRPRAIAV